MRPHPSSGYLVWYYDYRTNIDHTLKQKPMRFEHLAEFIQCCNPNNQHRRKMTWNGETNPEGRWRRYTYDELTARAKTSLDIFWLKDKGQTELDDLPEPDTLAQEIIENLESGLADSIRFPGRFRSVRPKRGYTAVGSRSAFQDRGSIIAAGRRSNSRGSSPRTFLRELCSVPKVSTAKLTRISHSNCICDMDQRTLGPASICDCLGQPSRHVSGGTIHLRRALPGEAFRAADLGGQLGEAKEGRGATLLAIGSMEVK